MFRIINYYEKSYIVYDLEWSKIILSLLKSIRSSDRTSFLGASHNGINYKCSQLLHAVTSLNGNCYTSTTVFISRPI